MVQEVKKFIPKSHEIGIKGRGGTHLYPAIKYIINNKIKHDFIVIITDGECESSWLVLHKSKYYFLLPKNSKLNLDTQELNCKIFYI
jgi:predicted metal-dependent peptidase